MADLKERPTTWQEWKARHRRWARWTSPEWALRWAVYWLKGLAVFQALELAGKTTVVVALVVWVMEADNRRQQKHYQAWSMINAARGGSGDGGRIAALQDLNRDGVSLSRLSAQNAMLEDIQLRYAKLNNANLQESILSKANLINADLSKSDLRKITLTKANLINTNFYRANLQNSILTEANLENANLNGANLMDAKLEGANLAGASLIEADLFGAKLTGANLIGADLTDADLSHADIKGVDLSHSVLCRTVRPEGDRSKRWNQNCPTPDVAVPTTSRR